MKPLPRPPGSAIGTNTGALAAAAWCVARDLVPTAARWRVEICLEDLAHDARLLIEIFNDEWGYRLCRGERESWIRVTDIAFVHGHDDFELLARTPRLEHLGVLVRALEDEHAVTFDRVQPMIRSTLDGIERIATWASTL